MSSTCSCLRVAPKPTSSIPADTTRHSLRFAAAMAPHLTGGELDTVRQCVARKMSANDILAAITAARRKARVDPPKIWAIRRAMAGATHLQGQPETRGRRKKLTATQAQRLFDKRSALVERAQGERYVPLREVRRAARVPAIDDTTTARYLRAYGVVWRRMREKPARTEAHEESRKAVCNIWRKRPASFWTDRVDLIIDAKKYALPGNNAAARRLRQQRVHATLRTRGEGLDPGHTRPNPKKHNFNAGGYVRILAGICGDRVVLWEEVRGTWSGQTAADMYAGPIKRVLQKYRPGKRSWLIMEDNDPAGFKSRKGIRAKEEHNLTPLSQPPYSPDLNPLDFNLWHAIETKTLDNRRKNETSAVYKARLRKTALSMPRVDVRNAVEAIKQRSQDIFEADGRHISRD